MRDRTTAYAAAIKAADPTAQTLGPVSWGWTAYFWSALDWAPGGAWWNNPQDRLAHGNMPFVGWYLQQMRTYEQQQGVRLLDYLDLHYYPEAAGVTLSPAGTAATQALRLRSTRSLWDPTYTDESWIAEPVRLVPRMHDWSDTYYPGTRLAISEYNWGALDNLNGALAQADVLGIFGREGLDLATLWAPPSSAQPGAFAFRLFLNYDGLHGRFGDVSVAAASADQEQLAVYAALDGAGGVLRLIIINKATQALTSPVTLGNFSPSAAAQVYRYSAANLAAIVREADLPVSQTGFTATFPASSLTLLVVPASIAAPAPIVTLTGTATPTATSTPRPTQTVTATRSPTPSARPSSTFTPTPTRTATRTATRTPTRTPTTIRTATPTPTRTAPRIATPTRTPQRRR
jgi:hypothetical protein